MYVVIELEPYGKKLQVEGSWGPFKSESDARAFCDEYAEHFHGNDPENDPDAAELIEDGVLRIVKLSGTDASKPLK
jgi:hypothetical protein